WGKLSSSMVSATLGFLAIAFSFGALGGVPSTNSRPSQWNQMGTTRGVPSVQMYARRAGIVDCSKACEAGGWGRSSDPCFTGMTVLTLRYDDLHLQVLFDPAFDLHQRLIQILKGISHAETQVSFAKITKCGA